MNRHNNEDGTHDSEISDLSSLNITDEFGRRMLEAERQRRDQKRLHNAVTGNAQAIRFARTRSGVASYMSKLNDEETQENGVFDKPQATAGPRQSNTTSMGSPTAGPRQWGSKARRGGDYLKRITATELNRGNRTTSSNQSRLPRPRATLFDSDSGAENTTPTDPNFPLPSTEAVSPTKSSHSPAKSRAANILRRNSFLDSLIKRERDESPASSVSPSPVKASNLKREVVREDLAISLEEKTNNAPVRKSRPVSLGKSASTIGSILGDLNDDQKQLSPQPASTTSSPQKSPRGPPEIPPRVASRDLLRQLARASSATPSPPKHSKAGSRYTISGLEDAALRFGPLGTQSPKLEDEKNQRRTQSTSTGNFRSLPERRKLSLSDARLNQLPSPPFTNPATTQISTLAADSRLPASKDEALNSHPIQAKTDPSTTTRGGSRQNTGLSMLLAQERASKPSTEVATMGNSGLKSLQSLFSWGKTQTPAPTKTDQKATAFANTISEEDQAVMEQATQNLRAARRGTRDGFRAVIGPQQNASKGPDPESSLFEHGRQQITLWTVLCDTMGVCVASLYRRTTSGSFRFTWLGLIILCAAIWAAAEVTLCEFYCDRPTPLRTSAPGRSLTVFGPRKPMVVFTMLTEPLQPVLQPALAATFSWVEPFAIALGRTVFGPSFMKTTDPPPEVYAYLAEFRRNHPEYF